MARPLRVGVQLPEVEREVRWPEYSAMAIAAEEAGFDSIWVGDHLLYRDDGRPERGPWEAWTTLAALAAITHRVRLGPLVACLAFHPPGLVAKMAATLHEVSGGRFILGVGAGWNEEEFRAFGIPFDRRLARFTEAFEIVRRLLAGERVTFAGRYVSVEDAVVLPLPEAPPLMIGSTGERVLTAALPHVDAWNTWFDAHGNTPEGFASLNARVTEIAERVGRAPQEVARSACTLVTVDASSKERTNARGVEGIPAEPTRLTKHLRDLAEAGADEAILVLNPITEASIRKVGEAILALQA